MRAAGSRRSAARRAEYASATCAPVPDTTTRPSSSSRARSQKVETVRPSWLTSTTVQYNNADSLWGFNARLNYIFRPGDDLFVVYNEGRRAIFDHEGRQIAGVFDGRKDRSLQIKLTYSFDY